ncbi:MAG TPA: signal peptidase I [Acidimicrobiia bacterium]|nr:signal peptidase I [Acidimicrobiia bacterium]
MPRFLIVDHSMEPALSDGDHIRCTRLRDLPPRGAVAVFVHPLIPDFWLIKRVIGLPGEEVEIDLGQVLINGRPGLDAWGRGGTFPDGHWKLGPGTLFVLSDNREATVDDSRRFGPVSTEGMLVATRRSLRRPRLRR